MLVIAAVHTLYNYKVLQSVQAHGVCSATYTVQIKEPLKSFSTSDLILFVAILPQRVESDVK